VPEDSLLSPFPHDTEVEDISKEISNTTMAIEMVHRCSADKILTVFHRTGSELLPLLLNEIQEQLGLCGTYPLHHHHYPSNESFDVAACDSSAKGISSITTDDSEHRTGGHHLKSCTKIIAHFARAGSLTEILAASNGLMSTLQYVTSSPYHAGTVPIEARLNSLWIIANLACSAENMIRMVRNPGLLQTLIEVILHPSQEDEEKVDWVLQYMELLRCRSVGLRAILNLSWAHENKTLFAEHVRLVEVLISTANHKESTWGAWERCEWCVAAVEAACCRGVTEFGGCAKMDKEAFVSSEIEALFGGDCQCGEGYRRRCEG